MIIITGPTCTGKTALGIELAKNLQEVEGRDNTEIISADSRQVYKYLTVGTAKPIGRWEKTGRYNNISRYVVDGGRYSIPYHLVDFLEPHEVFSAGDFVRLTESIVNQLIEKNKIPIIVGGTGLYIWSYLYGICPLPKRDENIREMLKNEEKKHGRGYLYNKLYRFDPEAAKRIHPNNQQRIIRALEVYYLTGNPISYWWAKNTNTKSQPQLSRMLRNHNILIGLYQPREILYQRINKRVCEMLQNGMIEETQELLRGKYRGDYDESCPAMQSVGYKHVVSYLKRQISFDDMKLFIQQDTRNYAKRQITWFKRMGRWGRGGVKEWINGDKCEGDIIWFDTSRVKLTEIVKFILKNHAIWRKSLSSE
ncbi:MAG: tRNA (adenosine(37)-N6)-dimethylallyltransferase MiaA [Elusimicrobiota bacterium]|nr:tRNA (adenosine(37)-N6)-dimethylallyltransferase MiaA [Elusimicrobiota bacterium]